MKTTNEQLFDNEITFDEWKDAELTADNVVEKHHELVADAVRDPAWITHGTAIKTELTRVILDQIQYALENDNLLHEVVDRLSDEGIEIEFEDVEMHFDKVSTIIEATLPSSDNSYIAEELEIEL